MPGAAAAVLLLTPYGVAHFGATSSVAPIASIRTPAAKADKRASRRADFLEASPSAGARAVADWIADSADNEQHAFAVLDKRGARLYVFERNATLLGPTMVLLGSATGDDTSAGVGDKPLAQIRPEERTTAAGRFVSEPGHDAHGDDVVWVDYDAAIAMHRVKVVDPRERRFERIATPSADDKRISNGCINVPIAFFDAVVKPALGASHAIVYVLPEVKRIAEVFANFYEVDSLRAGR